MENKIYLVPTGNKTTGCRGEYTHIISTGQLDNVILACVHIEILKMM